MLHILCILLKIIGILILVLLGLIVLIAGIMLFVPIRYRIEMKGEGTLQSLEVKVRFSWLLHLLSGYVSYADKKADWQVRTAWKKWNVPVSVQKKEETKKTEAEPEKTAEVTEQPKQIESKEDRKKLPPREVVVKKEKKRKKVSLLDKLKKIFQKIKYTIQNLCGKIKLFSEKKDKVLEFLEDELHRTAWGKTKQEIIRLLKYLRPKKIKGRVRFGFSDPYLTGKTLAILSMWYPFYASMLSIAPDFEKAVLEGNISVKGCIRGVYFLIPAFNIIRSKEIRQTYKHIRAFQL